MGDDLVLIMPGSLTFYVNQSDLKPGFLPVLDSVSLIMKAHLQRLINISGHADSTGSMAFNLDLSDRRAQRVARYLPGTGTEQARIETLGFGPRFPAADKTTANGRQLNRRVELFPRPIVRGPTLVDRFVICIDAVCVTECPFGWINCGWSRSSWFFDHVPRMRPMV